ncbi:hypothetical protein [Ruminiclostridium cellobioparum]|nr:hypothetical protein [Ruminiclostridium cellobioparum]
MANRYGKSEGENHALVSTLALCGIHQADRYREHRRAKKLLNSRNFQ